SPAVAGTAIELQLVCRDVNSPIEYRGGTGFGTPGADSMESPSEASILLGGLGNDHLALSKPGSAAFGGPGNDEIVVSAAGTAANGGFGNDRLVAETAGETLLVGGPGRDVLVGGSGTTRINALDGARGDRVVCGSAANLVIADEGDELTGPCTRVQPTAGN
ncbi:MAG: hypothetical protein ACKOCT_15285, partial [Alphaproteobacteria bacterium]